MTSSDGLRAALGATVAVGGGLAAANRLCEACVELLDVDGAAISVIHDGASRGTFGASGELSLRLDEFQFTYGEGPCLDATRQRRPVLVDDLGAATERRWPAFSRAVLAAGVRAVYALPIVVASAQVGALDLYRVRPGSLGGSRLAGGLLAAELAALPLLDLMSADVDWASAGEGGDGWSELASLERVEVYQATGMIMATLDVTPAEALIRLRGYAYAHGTTASEVAWLIVERRLALTDDDWRRPGGPVARA